MASHDAVLSVPDGPERGVRRQSMPSNSTLDTPTTSLTVSTQTETPVWGVGGSVCSARLYLCYATKFLLVRPQGPQGPVPGSLTTIEVRDGNAAAVGVPVPQLNPFSS